MKSVKIIGIIGASGSGKTTIARDLAQMAGDACLLSQDNYYHGLPQNEDAASWNFDDPAAVDLDHLARDLAALKRGEPVEQPRYIFSEHRRALDTLKVNPAPFFIVEGLFLFSTGALREVFDLKIFIDVPQRVCLERRIARDRAERGRSESMIRQRWADLVEPMFWKHIEPTRRFADQIISPAPGGTVEYNAQIQHLFHSLKTAPSSSASRKDAE